MPQAFWIVVVGAVILTAPPTEALDRVRYNHPGLTVDLGVGLWAWPLPMDWDGDGDLDLVVSSPDVPQNGTFLFENPSTSGEKMPTFRAAVRVGPALRNGQVSYVDGRPRVLTPATEWVDFLGKGFEKKRVIHPEANIHGSRVRANQWRYVDYDGDGDLDLIVAVGDWSDYGWDDAFDKDGTWTRGPLHGYVYVMHNDGERGEPSYGEPARVQAAGKPIDVYGMPSPSFADFDGDGDLDLLCGEFLDGFTYFENLGSRTVPRYAAGRRLAARMDLQMITPTAVDWDNDGDMDLVAGDEDGRVAFLEHTGRIVDGVPQFASPRYFQQVAADVKFGALVTPVSVDWDGDGDEDFICGNTAGYLGFIENLDGGDPPRWAAPVKLTVDGQIIRIQAGPNGSIQGPAEAKWGYTTLDVADWDHDGRLDIVVNSIWGKVLWYRNVGTATSPHLAHPRPIAVTWSGPPPKPAWNWWDPKGQELATQWRTTPVVVDWNRDGLNDLVMLDHEGYLALFRRRRTDRGLELLPGERLFELASSSETAGEASADAPLRLNDGRAGRSGRRKLCITDWDGDGLRDILVNSTSVDVLRNLGAGTASNRVRFENLGPVSDHRLAGHTTSPTVVDWNRDGVRDLVIGAEDGHLYYCPNLYTLTRIESPDLTVDGRHVELGLLADDERAFANRPYTWFDVPGKLRGWRFTRTSGGQRAVITVKARRNARVHVATAVSRQKTDLSGWEAIDELTFAYTDRGRTRLQVYSRTLEAGETIEVPQHHWTGTIVLLPPGE